MTNNIEQFIAQHPTVTCQAALKEICQPLLNLGVVYFAHAHIDAQFGMSTLGLEPEFFRQYFKQGFFQYDLHMACFEQKKSYVIWDTLQRQQQSEKLHQCFTEFDQDHTFSIIESTEHTKDVYHFATKPSDDSMNGRYLQLLDPFHAFINYFKEKVHSDKSLRAAYDMKISLDKQLGGYLIAGQKPIDTFQQFYQQVKSEKLFFEQGKYLSKRELECLHWMSLGKTAVESSMIMEISERTIKAHLKNVKEKLDCHTLFQLGMRYERWYAKCIDLA